METHEKYVKLNNMNKKLIFIPIIIVLLLVIAYIAANHVATTNAKEQTDNYIHKNKLEKIVSYEKVKASVFPKYISIKNLSINTEEKIIYINEGLVRSLDTKHDIPLYGDIEIRHISSPGSEEFTKIEEKLKKLGYGSLKINFRMKFNSNETARTQNIDYVTTIENAFKAGLIIKLNNVDFKKIREIQKSVSKKSDKLSPDDFRVALQDISDTAISYAEFYFKNEGLIDRLMKKEATDRGISEKKIKENTCKMLDMQIASAKTTAQKDFLKDIRKFIKKPRKISVKISPKTPVKIQEIIQCIMNKNTNKLFSNLNFSIET